MPTGHIATFALHCSVLKNCPMYSGNFLSARAFISQPLCCKFIFNFKYIGHRPMDDDAVFHQEHHDCAPFVRTMGVLSPWAASLRAPQLKSLAVIVREFPKK